MHLISKILAVSLAACWISPTLSAPAGVKQAFMNCTIKPKDTTFGTGGTFKRAVVSVNSTTLDDVLLYTSLTGAEQQRQRFFFIYQGQTTSSGVTKNRWVISSQYGNKCLSESVGNDVRAYDCSTTPNNWFLKALSDGTYLISNSFDHSNSWYINGDANTNGVAFKAGDPLVSSPGDKYRMEIRDCKDLAGNLVSVAP